MPDQKNTQSRVRSADPVMQQSLALRSFLGARAKRRAAKKAARDSRSDAGVAPSLLHSRENIRPPTK
jgi:hypothetical protein